MEGTMGVNLKGTKIEIEEATTWMEKIKEFFSGKEEYEKEDVELMQYIEQIGKVLEGVGMNNVVSLSINDDTVYEDDEHKENDLSEAIGKAMEHLPEEKENYTVVIELESDEEGNEDSVIVAMEQRHDPEDLPLTFEFDMEKSSEEFEDFIKNVKCKISEVFDVEEIETEIEDESVEDDEDSNDEDSDDEDSDNEEKKKQDVSEEDESVEDDEDSDDNEEKKKED